MNKIRERMVRVGMVTENSIQGCSEVEIQRIENDFGIKLPTLYREFLVTMGKRAGKLLEGLSAFFPNLLENRTTAEELVLNETEDGNLFDLPSDAFVFAQYIGMRFYFFRVQEGDDPPVYFYEEEKTYCTKIADTFSGFLENEIDDYVRLHNEDVS
jgi:SMI1 / KNR4 family (SUKH-1)